MDIQAYGRKNCYTVSVTATAIAINTTKDRIGLVIRNNSTTTTAYLGNSADVTTSTGFPLLPGEIIQDLDSYDPNEGDVDNWYAISSGTVDVRCIEYLG
jgi:hypothetical protein